MALQQCVLGSNIYSAKSTRTHCVYLDSELTFAPISVKLVLDWEPVLVALLHIKQHYLP